MTEDPFTSGTPGLRHYELLDAPLSRLTPRQSEALGLLAVGKSNKEIALALGVLPQTIKSTFRKVFKKLGVHTRIEAALIYNRRESECPNCGALASLHRRMIGDSA
jgi:DNA-binding NarL/FixJ family response regulator